MIERQYKYVINDVSKKEYWDDKQGIRILDTADKSKVIVAKEVSSYMSAVSRKWDTLFRKDVNASDLCDHLNGAFPELEGGWEFRLMPSQKAFDIVCLELGVIIEVKSVAARSKYITANATVYPDRVKAKDALPVGFKYPTFKEFFKTVTNPRDRYLDVLVVCVTHKNNVVQDFAIVDGNYWGIKEKHYLGCKDYFSDVNKYKDDINLTVGKQESNIFAFDMAKSHFGKALVFHLRKLIHLINPVGRINVLGKFDLPK